MIYFRWILGWFFVKNVIMLLYDFVIDVGWWIMEDLWKRRGSKKLKEVDKRVRVIGRRV